ncbi:MAG TPA: hypothetical protein VFY20_05625 [Gemmatimonadales bacterium]|nr:hypothetical protein [Gemmatimonadales bacterium]
MRRVLLALLTCAVAGASGVAAQGSEPWRFNGLRDGYCVEFLVDSAKIRGFLPDGALPMRADRMQSLHPAIARTVKEQPEYGSWTPAAACFYLFDEVVVAGRPMPASKAAGEMIGFVSYSARLLEDRGKGGDVLDALVASNWKGMRSADEQGLRLERSPVALEAVPNSENRRITVKVGGTTLRWEGHDASDSAAASTPIERRWMVRGADRRYRLVTMRVAPTSSRSMIGSLIVQGDDDLAKALRSSPIRYVGPNYRGGSGELRNEIAN